MRNDGLILVIGNKNLSSWSLRPWLVLRASGLKFKGINIELDLPQTTKNIEKYSPSGKVPVLIHGDLHIWDSLAISEYIAELSSDLAPEKNLWPSDIQDRALARSYVSEMHSGFMSLRTQLSMDISLRMEIKHLVPGTINDIQRIISIWETCLTNSKGPFLFGEFGIIDAFYAPVIFRFQSYGIKIKNKKIQKYMQSILKLKIVQEWIKSSQKEKYHAYTF